MVDRNLLLDYMNRFVGFGSSTADLWFIGLEQGGGESIAELARRLQTWADLRKEPFADLRDYCLSLGELRWHGDPTRIQATLGKLVRLTLAADGISPTIESVRRYQAHRFGRATGRTVIAELMPLPSRNVSEWIYSELKDVPGLQSRDSYVREYRPRRIKTLRDAIRTAAPRAVVFLGASAAETWSEVAEARFAAGPADVLWARSGPTLFLVLRHPTAFGAKNTYFENAGRELVAKKLAPADE